MNKGGYAGGNHTLTYMNPQHRTLLVTKEDFNIEDIHCQMVFKVQRELQLLKEIEGEPSDKIPPDSSLMTAGYDEFGRAP